MLKQTRVRRAFSLTELLVVIGIIALLAAMALPALSRARNAAREASTQATINVIEHGAEQFRLDAQLGGAYPPSYYLAPPSGPPAPGPGVISPHNSNRTIAVGGASLIVWATAGADLLGSPGFRDLNGRDGMPPAGPVRTAFNGLVPWRDDTFAETGNASGLYSLYPAGAGANAGKPMHPRNFFGVDVTKMSFPKRQGDEFIVPAVTNGQTLQSLCYLDAWGQPILYYRANPMATALAHDQLGGNCLGIYNGTDNWNIAPVSGSKVFTGMDFGAGNSHFSNVREDNTGTLGDVANPNDCRGSFAYRVWDPNVTVRPQPQRAESFLLLSPGIDGLYGTADDVGNFTMNETRK